MWRYFEKILITYFKLIIVQLISTFRFLFFYLYVFFLFPSMQDMDVLRSTEWELIIIDESQCTGISPHCAEIKLLATKRRLLLVSGPLKVFIFLCLLLWILFQLFLVVDLSNATGYGRIALLNTVTCYLY